MTRLNETPASSPEVELGVWIGEHRLLFEGPLEDLDWHRHSFACVLVGIGQEITLVTREGEATGGVVLAPGGLDHVLRFDGGRVLSYYIPPHDPMYAALMAHSGGKGMVCAASEAWAGARSAWTRHRDPSPLADAVARTWGAEEAALDHMVTRIAKTLWRGEQIRSGTSWFAESVGLSPSRLSFLLKRDTRSTLGELQRGYRFWHAARVLLDVTTFTEAAHASEFADAAHFSRAFRAAYGLAPSGILLTRTQWFRCDAL